MKPGAHESAVDARIFDEYRGIGARGAADDFVTRLIDQYLADATLRMAELSNAVACRDAPAVSRATHNLKGSSGAVGAGRMAGICKELEQLARNLSFDDASALVAVLDDEFARVRHALQVERGIPEKL